VTAVSSRSGDMSPCALCSSIARPRAPWDRPLFESENLVAVPSLGSLVEGWLLIVPRAHFISTGSFDRSLERELAAFKREIWARLETVYGEVCAFEHGPYAPRRQAGCGVDHAHVHLVPLSFDLAKAALPFLSTDADWTRASWSDCSRAIEREVDYLFVEQPLGVGRIAVADRFGSQILRKAIATAIGKPREFDWREYPQQHVIDSTISRLSVAAVGV
jgi:ATP adenylyltransferase